jgi:hypothetical protein
MWSSTVNKYDARYDFEERREEEEAGILSAKKRGFRASGSPPKC